MHKCFWAICWPSRKDLEEPGLYFQTWVTSDDPSDDSDQAEQAQSDVARQAQVDCATNFVQHADEVNQVQMSGGATTSDDTSTHAVRQASIDSSSCPFESDEDTSALVVHTSDGASQFNDCVHSSSEESFIPSPQDSVPSVHEVRGIKAVKGLEVESEARDVLRALPPDSEMRFASMVAAAQQAAAAALSAASPRRKVGEGNKVAGQSLPTPRRALNTPRSARTPRAGSKRDRKVTSSKKKKKSSLSPEQQPVSVQD